MRKGPGETEMPFSLSFEIASAWQEFGELRAGPILGTLEGSNAILTATVGVCNEDLVSESWTMWKGKACTSDCTDTAAGREKRRC